MKKFWKNISTVYRLHFCFIILTIFFSYLIFLLFFSLGKKYSGSVFIVIEEIVKSIIFFIFSIFSLFFMNFNLEKYEKNVDYNHQKLNIIRTLNRRNAILYEFYYFPLIVSIAFPFIYNISIALVTFKSSNASFFKPEIIFDRVFILFLSECITSMLYFDFSIKRSYFPFFLLPITCLYRIFLVFLSNQTFYLASLRIFSFINLIIFIIILIHSINQNIKGNIYD